MNEEIRDKEVEVSREEINRLKGISNPNVLKPKHTWLTKGGTKTKFVILEKAKGFRMAKYGKKLGEEESSSVKRERQQTGGWEPKRERMEELARGPGY